MTVSALAQSALERAVTLTRERRYAEARSTLEEVSEPSSVDQRIAFHRLKAAIASGLGEAAQAAQEMGSALALAPGDPGLRMGTAVAEQQSGDVEEKRGNFVAAAKAYQAAVALAPGREDYRIALALEFVQHYTFEPAIDVLTQAVPLFPKSARIRTLLGISQYAVRRVDEAIESLTDALQIDPGLEPASAYLMRITLVSAAAPQERTIKILCGRSAEVCSALKLRVAREKDDETLRKEAIEGLKRAPAASALATCELGRAYEWSAEWTKARERMEACVRLDPSPENHYRLGLIYGELDLPDLARREMKLRNEAIERTSQDIARHQDAVQAFQYVSK